MDTAIARPVVPLAQTQPIRTIGEAAPVKTDLPPEATVQQGADASALRDKDERPDSDLRRQVQTDVAATNRREIESDAATGVFVMKVIEAGSGDVVDQVPTDAYLRLKVALQSLLDSSGQAGAQPNVAKRA